MTIEEIATYCPTPYSNQTYVQITTKGARSNNVDLIFCVDKSGSMAGSAIKNVCQKLREIYLRTNVPYALYSYNTQVQRGTLADIKNDDIVAVGGTSFEVMFRGIQEHIMANTTKPMSFIFMTDGVDSNTNPSGLKMATESLRLTCNAMSAIPVTIHVIGFGAVKPDFLETVRMLGNKEGLFKYSTESGELQDNFDDMFDYATSSREVTIEFDSKSYTTNCNDEAIGFLIPSITGDHPITIKLAGQEISTTLSPMKEVRPIHLVRALNLVSPKNEKDVRAVLQVLDTLVPSGPNKMEKLAVEEISTEITNRMLEYVKLYSQIKMGQIPEHVKLRLSALQHDAKFSSSQRERKLRLRVSDNSLYFQKTDIDGILMGYMKNITPQARERFKLLSPDWVDAYSGDDFSALMRSTPDNIMCLGIEVERTEAAIDSPITGIKIKSVTNTIISYDSFIRAITLAKFDDENSMPTNTEYGDFSKKNEKFIVIGTTTKEKINAIIPLFIDEEHMKRVRILEGIVLGYLFTLNSRGYDKMQEVALLKMLYEMIALYNGTTRSRTLITEFSKVCKFIITESIGFKTAYGESTYSKFVSSIHGRSNKFDLSIPLIIGYLNDDIERALIPVYLEYVRQNIKKDSKTDDTIKRLLYGTAEQTVAIVDKTTQVVPQDLSVGPDFLEKTYADYFDDEMCEPIPLFDNTTIVKEKTDRKGIIDTDVPYIKSLLAPVPKIITDMLKYAGMDENYIDTHINYNVVRQELLMMLYFDTIPAHITIDTVYDFVDNALQGHVDNIEKFQYSQDNINVVTYKLITSKSLKGFGGLLRKYCPKRNGPFFDSMVKSLLLSENNKDKLIALMTNRIGLKCIYPWDNICWMPLLKDDMIQVIRTIIGDRFALIEADHIAHQKKVHRCYRLGFTNCHKHGNHNPCEYNMFRFVGYDIKNYTDSRYWM
jgi:hypothetical protein